MSTIVVHSTGCPKCKALKMKLDMKHIQYTENTDVAKMEELEIKSAPMLQVDDEWYGFSDAIKWVNSQ